MPRKSIRQALHEAIALSPLAGSGNAAEPPCAACWRRQCGEQNYTSMIRA
jgi:hypothetical protein